MANRKKTTHKDNKPFPYLTIISLTILASAIFLALYFYAQGPSGLLERHLSRVFKDYAVTPGYRSAIKEYYVDFDDIEHLQSEVKDAAKQSGFYLKNSYNFATSGKRYSILELAKKPRGSFIFILKLIDRKELKRPRVIWKKKKAKVAIILDDWGYNMNNAALLNSIEVPLTLSILPNLAYSAKVAAEQSRRGNREIMLHMPMEPESSGVRLEKNTITVSMSQKEARELLDMDLKSVSYARGISNHMGSKATKDKKIMRYLMEELAKKGLCFVDSVATPGTVCEQQARAAGVRFAKRDIFLDNKADKEYIAGQLNKVIELARKNGSAVGIGHDRVLTLQVLKEKSQAIEDDNAVEFVLIDEVLK